jgi:flagellar biosynthesis/type III secretory pathway protein FliH
MQAAAAEHAQGFAQGEAAGQKAGQEFGRTYAGLLFLGSAVFSLIVSALLSWKMAFSNLFPWCRAR